MHGTLILVRFAYNERKSITAGIHIEYTRNYQNMNVKILCASLCISHLFFRFAGHFPDCWDRCVY